MNEQKKEYIENCDFIKIVLMILVVVYHSCVFWGGGWIEGQSVEIEAPALARFAGWLSSFHVYGFTLVSGYLFFYLHYETGKYTNYWKFIKGKVRRLIIPYWFVAICWVIPISSFVNSFSLGEILKRFILCANPAQLWFLWMLFDVFIMVWPLRQVLRKKYVWAVICLISWGVGYFGNAYFPNIFCIWTAFSYLPYFVFGMKLREKKESVFYRVPAVAYVLLQILLYYLWRRWASQSNMVGVGAIQIMANLVYTVGALMSFFVLQKLADRIKWKRSSVFLFLSRKTMPVYLFHQEIIYFSILWLNGKVNPYFNAVINIMFSLFVSLLLSSLLMKYKVTRTLIGEK